MTTSSYMPDVKVEVAWDGGFRIPMADWTWTDISADVELEDNLTISGGRGDERSTADANTLTLTLDNSSGDYTAGRVTSANYPNVVLYKPIRVLATPVDGTESVRFTGYVTSWPVEWEDTEAYAKATVTATSRLARLGLNAQWRSLVEETILADAPAAYFPLGEPEGSTMAADVSGLGGPPLVMVGAGDPVVFGQATGPGTDDLTAATFSGGQFLSKAATVTVEAGVSVEAFILASGLTDVGSLFTSGNVLVYASGGDLVARAAGAEVSSSGVFDGATHHVAVTWDGTTLRLYLDGAEVDSAAAAGSPEIGPISIGDSAVTATFVGAHLATFDSVLSAGRILAHATSGAGAWAGETTDERLVRYAAMAEIPAAEVAAEAGSTTMTHLDTTNANVVDMLRMVEQTEAGVLFDDRDGNLTLHSRAHRYDTSPVVTLDMAKHEVEVGYSPRLDPSTLINDITVTGMVASHLVNEDSKEANGVATGSLTTASENPDEPLNLASWALLQFSTPRPRVPSLAMNATTQAVAFAAGASSASCADLMAVTVGDKVRVANHPQQAQLSISDYFVEGWTETYGPESLTITWNVSPSSPDDQIYVFDDPVYGDLDVYALPL